MVSNGGRHIFGLINKGQFEIVSLTPQIMPGALKTMREFFLGPNFPPAYKVDANSATELEKLCVFTATDGVSLAAVEKATGIVAATVFNKIHVRPKLGESTFFENFLRDHCTCNGSKNVLRSFIAVDNAFNVFDHYKTDCYFEIFIASTLPEFRSQKLWTKLTEATFELAEDLATGERYREPLILKHENDIIENYGTADKTPEAVVAVLLNEVVAAEIPKYKVNIIANIPKKKLTDQGETPLSSTKEDADHSSIVVVGRSL